MIRYRKSPPIARRRAVGQPVAGIVLGFAALFLAACGGSSDAPSAGPSAAPEAKDVKGTAVYLNYPGWIGENTVATFEEKHPDAQIKESASGFESTAGVAVTIAQNPDAYDLVFASGDIAEQLTAGNFLMDVGEAAVPALADVEPRLREAFPYGVPIDTGYVGIAYRKDLVPELITSWAEFWALAPKYSGKVDFSGNDRTALGSALLYKGYEFDSVNPDELAEARDAILEIKPHIRAFKVTGLDKGLLDGGAVMSTVANYEAAAAIAKDPNIAFVVPEEGAVGYVEGIVALKGTDVPEVGLAFMDHFMQPEQYADFVNTTSAARTTRVGDELISKDLLTPEFDWPEDANAIGFLGADGVELWSKTWSEVKAG
jgi:spermidine/putrescine transport system substrate-binding protein